MISVNQFNAVFDCQKIFRALMNALAQPGKVFSIAESVEKLEGEGAPLMAVGLTLLDNWRKFYVEGDDDLTEPLRELTYGVPSSLKEADYIFFPQVQENLDIREVLGQVKPGTLPEPHRSATLIFLLPSLTGGKELLLSGPGIDGEISVTLPDWAGQWLKERQAMEFEFPCGVELYFLTPDGQVMGVPRKIKVRGRD